MADDKSKTGGPDRKRVSGSERYEIQYEAEKQGVSPGVIRSAIKKAGPSREKVEKQIKRDKRH